MGKYITTGLWAYSRHPNYFGEILMWCCQAGLVSSAALHMSDASVLHAAWISPVFTWFLLLKVSGVPMVEKAGLEKWGKDKKYMMYVNSTSCVVPWFPKAASVETGAAKAASDAAPLSPTRKSPRNHRA